MGINLARRSFVAGADFYWLTLNAQFKKSGENVNFGCLHK